MENRTTLKNWITNLERDLTEATRDAAELMTSSLWDLDKEIKKPYYKNELIKDAKKIFEELYERAKLTLEEIKSDYEHGSKEPEPEELKEIPW